MVKHTQTIRRQLIIITNISILDACESLGYTPLFQRSMMKDGMVERHVFLIDY